MQDTLTEFIAWLQHNGSYRETSLVTFRAHAKALLRTCAEGCPETHFETKVVTAKHLLRWDNEYEETKLEPTVRFHLLQFVDAHETSQKHQARWKKKNEKRKSKPRSFDEDVWAQLVPYIERDRSPEARILEVMCATGLRVGDVLRIEWADLNDAFRSGTFEVELKGGYKHLVAIDGALAAWTHLRDLGKQAGKQNRGKTVQELICPNCAPSGQGAYHRVDRKLKAIQKQLGLTRHRFNTHRIRRTVGVQAHKLTKDVIAVQQLMGHQSHSTTLGYLDEARPDDVAALQKQIRSKFHER